MGHFANWPPKVEWEEDHEPHVDELKQEVKSKKKKTKKVSKERLKGRKR